ncbi:hypothetical protein ACLFMI_10280 [Pseudonocardia nantongensis]|uniref:hypothetical protein n=1 Tax=Pseudonocardia nantongensis TaxID=1181885 RepID=UPI00397E630B
MDDDPEEAVLAAATAAAVAESGDGLVAVLTLGSLAHGGFAPLVSDVDLALVLRTTGEDTAGRVHDVVQRTRLNAPGVLAERLSVFWADSDAVRHGPGAAPARLPAVDRLDLIDSGVLRHGMDVRDGAARPGRETMVAEAAAFAVERFDDAWFAGIADPVALLRGGPRPVTKTVLFPVRFLHTLRTGEIGRNAAAAASYATAGGAHRELVTAAQAWRTEGLGDRTVAVDLLSAQLAGLYREFVDAHLDALPENDPSRPGLAALRRAIDAVSSRTGGRA